MTVASIIFVMSILNVSISSTMNVSTQNRPVYSSQRSNQINTDNLLTCRAFACPQIIISLNFERKKKIKSCQINNVLVENDVICIDCDLSKYWQQPIEWRGTKMSPMPDYVHSSRAGVLVVFVLTACLLL